MTIGEFIMLVLQVIGVATLIGLAVTVLFCWLASRGNTTDISFYDRGQK